MSYDQQTQGKQSGMMGAVLIAAAVGAVAGMLLAPKRGSEMREDIMGRYNGAKNKATDMAESAREKMTHGVETARNKVHDVADRSKDVADKAADKARDMKAEQDEAATLAEHIEAEHSRRGRRSSM